MIDINESDKNRIKRFIKDNNLDYDIIDNSITRFHIISEDGMKFQFQYLEENLVLVRYNPKKDESYNNGSQPFEYFYFKTLPSLLEQLLFHDRSINKTYWNLIQDSMEVGLVGTYDSDLYKDFLVYGGYNISQEYESYEILVYSNDSYKPELKHPYNTIHEVSPINDISYNRVNRLYFEIHPVSCQKDNESYLFRILCNNEDIMKEYINYMVWKKKGLRLFLEGLLNDMERFKSN